MSLSVSKNGSFSYNISSDKLQQGLRRTKRNPRNSDFLTTCSGAVGRDGVLQSIDQLTGINVLPSEIIGTDTLNYTCIAPHTAAPITYPITGANWADVWIQKGSEGITWVDGTTYLDGINDGFPYPQIFVFPNVIIVCGETGIFEWDGSKVVRKLTVTAGYTWYAVEFGDFIYMSNGTVAVTRDPSSKVYSVSSVLPAAGAMCNFNGQVILGDPKAV